MPWGSGVGGGIISVNISFGCFARPKSVFPASPSHMRKMSHYFCNWPSPHVASQGSLMSEPLAPQVWGERPTRWYMGSECWVWCSTREGSLIGCLWLLNKLQLCVCMCVFLHGLLIENQNTQWWGHFCKRKTYFCCSAQIQRTVWGLRHDFKLG